MNGLFSPRGESMSMAIPEKRNAASRISGIRRFDAMKSEISPSSGSA
jgi:hypothetical protein